MCDFLTIALPSASKARLAAWRRRNYDLSPGANPSIKARLPSGYRQWVLTTAGCSCDLVKHTKQISDLVGLRSDVTDILDELLGEQGEGFMVLHAYTGDIQAERVSLSNAPPLMTIALRSGEPLIKRDHIIPLVMRRGEPNQTHHRMAAPPSGLANRESRRGRHR